MWKLSTLVKILKNSHLFINSNIQDEMSSRSAVWKKCIQSSLLLDRFLCVILFD